MIDGRRPLHYAADYGQKEIIEYLITKQGADVNVSVSILFWVLFSKNCHHFPGPGQAQHQPAAGGHLGGAHRMCPSADRQWRPD